MAMMTYSIFESSWFVGVFLRGYCSFREVSRNLTPYDALEPCRDARREIEEETDEGAVVKWPVTTTKGRTRKLNASYRLTHVLMHTSQRVKHEDDLGEEKSYAATKLRFNQIHPDVSLPEVDHSSVVRPKLGPFDDEQGETDLEMYNLLYCMLRHLQYVTTSSHCVPRLKTEEWNRSSPIPARLVPGWMRPQACSPGLLRLQTSKPSSLLTTETGKSNGKRTSTSKDVKSSWNTSRSFNLSLILHSTFLATFLPSTGLLSRASIVLPGKPSGASGLLVRLLAPETAVESFGMSTPSTHQTLAADPHLYDASTRRDCVRRQNKCFECKLNIEVLQLRHVPRNTHDDVREIDLVDANNEIHHFRHALTIWIRPPTRSHFASVCTVS